jgi:undecaprenyl-phosphate galactose phosphotransferase/putative colanic acid biosynthesis UDP-glucose lipid carrier transferase
VSARAFSAHEPTLAQIAPPDIAADYRARNTSFLWQTWLRPAVIERLLAVCDGLIILACGLGSTIGYHWMTSATPGKVDVYGAASALIAVNFVLLMTLQHGYRLRNITRTLRQVRLALATWTGVFAALLAIIFAMKVAEEYSRGTTILFFVSGAVTLSAWKAYAARWTARALRTGAFTNSRIVVIAEHGLTAASHQIAELRQHGYRLMRVLEIPAKELGSPLMMSAIGNRFNELTAFARENDIEHVFLLMSWNRQHAIDSVLDALKVLPLPVHLVPDANVARFLRYPQVSDGGTWTAELRRAPLSFKERALKRMVDIAGSLAGLLVFAPVMLTAAILIKATSPGPAFFRQTRNGFNGRAFRIYKFRSMRVLEDGPRIVQATRDDPRVTTIGKWLRKTSIDELPQLINVLNGDMSLVGPRPHAAAHNSQYEQLIGNYAFRHHVKPGITGWAQINGFRGETREIALMEKRVEHDLWYINNWSLWLDVVILLRTALIAFGRQTAY